MVAVLAGVALGFGVQCSDGMAATAYASPPMVGMQAHEPVPAGLDALGASHGDEGSVPDGMLMTCLAFLVGVVVSVLIARPVAVSRAGSLVAVRVWAREMPRPRAPSLAQLCLLRT
ncbi:hypothetical protein SAMN04488074_12870 [Lentzea albidocapillata subsp. violacea]|uniref:Uncharacterized protein n=1 Tax=Lentzea albidocapillata subsp. violacea TaxID=128104 RepID=A0A1G9WSM5_9PSEU|nr:hypothetical protein SAMN04488074_12870 [Lentzea albidocapillata subsp. violacea]